MKNIAIFASGSGPNAENIIKYFSTRNSAKVSLVLCNKQHALVIKRAGDLGVKAVFFDRSDFYTSGRVPDLLIENKIDFIILAGFLWLVPESLTRTYEKRMINIHPALLPSYGGKGMYGEIVHKAVIENREKESGITIHYVNDHYDEGDVIFQARCKVEPDDDHESLAKKIHTLEYEHFPRVIEELIERLPD
jgi:phosphoribosylglycinamide formyltransferase-1